MKTYKLIVAGMLGVALSVMPVFAQRGGGTSRSGSSSTSVSRSSGGFSGSSRSSNSFSGSSRSHSSYSAPRSSSRSSSSYSSPRSSSRSSYSAPRSSSRSSNSYSNPSRSSSYSNVSRNNSYSSSHSRSSVNSTPAYRGNGVSSSRSSVSNSSRTQSSPISRSAALAASRNSSITTRGSSVMSSRGSSGITSSRGQSGVSSSRGNSGVATSRGNSGITTSRSGGVMNGGRPSGVVDNGRPNGVPNRPLVGNDYARPGHPGVIPPSAVAIRPAPYFYCPYYDAVLYMNLIPWYAPAVIRPIYWPGFWLYCNSYWYDYHPTDVVVVREYVDRTYGVDLIAYAISGQYMYALVNDNDGYTYLQVFDENDHLLAEQQVHRKYRDMQIDRDNGGCWITKKNGKDPLLFFYTDGQLLIYETE